jgi:hypothetical protein
MSKIKDELAILIKAIGELDGQVRFGLSISAVVAELRRIMEIDDGPPLTEKIEELKKEVQDIKLWLYLYDKRT